MALLEPSRSLLRALGILALLVVAAVGGWALLRPRVSEETAASRIRVPEPTGITVEVVNASGRQGLARLVTRMLRDRGFDVLFFGTAREPVDSTSVVLRRGDSTRAVRVARALNIERVRVAIDTLLRLDVTVILGADYQPQEAR